MKKSILVFVMSLLLMAGGVSLLRAQEQPAPKKDTVNMDTNAKPEFYYKVEDEQSAKKGNSSMVIIIAVAVVVVAGVVVLVTRKKKK